MSIVLGDKVFLWWLHTGLYRLLILVISYKNKKIKCYEKLIPVGYYRHCFYSL